MRGDSLRDRYAKGLALLGLGMLAGAGAVVDNWPAAGHLPLVPPAEWEPLAAAPRPSLDPLAVVVPLPIVARRGVAGAAVPPAPIERPAPVLRVSQMARTFGEPVALTPPPPAPAVPALTTPVAILASTGRPDTLGGGESLILPPLASPRPPTQWASEEDDDSFLTGAVKSAGASILRTSARAGASVFDVFRSLGNTVRRALPN